MESWASIKCLGVTLWHLSRQAFDAQQKERRYVPAAYLPVARHPAPPRMHRSSTVQHRTLGNKARAVFAEYSILRLCLLLFSWFALPFARNQDKRCCRSSGESPTKGYARGVMQRQLQVLIPSSVGHRCFLTGYRRTVIRKPRGCEERRAKSLSPERAG
ncbi:MAG: hypothetical protein JWP34_4628 [Massilia sp.]|nr:hypothetical protein [Massilia sp.]